MTGGISSSIHRLTVVTRSGRRHLVLRRWLGGELADGQFAAAREGRILDALARAGFPAPAPVAVSDGSDTDGVPAVLMTRSPGHVFLTPREPDSWLKQMAEILPRLHALDIAAEGRTPEAQSEPRPKPDWIERATTWKAAQAVLMERPPDSPRCFVHNDFQHFNLLWQRERLTGVVDWTWPGRGSPDADVGHCRLNLAVLHSVDWAERFRLAYEGAAGRTVHPWFDLRRITAFSSHWQRFIPLQVCGRAAVDTDGMPGRVEALMASVLKRL